MDISYIINELAEERENYFKSKGRFDVYTFTKKYFNGGWHFNSTGGFNKEPLEEVLAKFKLAKKENVAQLSSYQF